jgi:hypothetical protein
MRVAEARHVIQAAPADDAYLCLLQLLSRNGLEMTAELVIIQDAGADYRSPPDLKEVKTQKSNCRNKALDKYAQ